MRRAFLLATLAATCAAMLTTAAPALASASCSISQGPFPPQFAADGSATQVIDSIQSSCTVDWQLEVQLEVEINGSFQIDQNCPASLGNVGDVLPICDFVAPKNTGGAGCTGLFCGGSSHTVSHSFWAAQNCAFVSNHNWRESYTWTSRTAQIQTRFSPQANNPSCA